MKRGSSATSLHNLAASIKNSILKDFPKGQTLVSHTPNDNQRHLFLGRTKSTINLNTKTNNLYFTPLQQTINTKAVQTNCRKNELKGQIIRLEEQICKLKGDNGKSVVRSYDKQLQLYDQSNKHYKAIEKQLLKRKQQLFELNNRVTMVKQDLAARQFNTTEVLAQKQYYQEVLQTYQNQYQSESEVVIQMIKLEIRNRSLYSKVSLNSQQIDRLVMQLQQWKQQYEYEFNNKKAKGKITQARVQLISIQQKADQYAKIQCCMKIRELLCLFIKKYVIDNYKITKKGQLQQGLELYICKEGICKILKEFMLQRNRDKPQYQRIITSYCKIIQRMQNTVSNSHKQASNKIVDGYNLQIEQLRASNIVCNNQINQNKLRLAQLKNRLDLIFGNENVVLIQIMKQKTGKIELDSIKNKLREMANEQQKRVKKMKQIFIKSQNLRLDQQYYLNQGIIQQLRSLNNAKQQKQQQVDQIRAKLKQVRQQKVRIQEKLSDAVTSWKQHSNKKKKLKRLYKQLDQCQKQKVKCVQQQKKNAKAAKHYDKENIDPIRKILSCSIALSKNITKNSSNRISNDLFKIHRKKSASVLTQPVTYKNSINSTTNKNTYGEKDFKKSNLTKQTRTNSQRGQLTNLLISKFVK